VTDIPGDSNIILRTAAEAIPAIRVEEDAKPEGAVLMGTNESRRARFRVLAAGTSNEPPLDLDRAELRSSIHVEWLGSKQIEDSDDHFKIESRLFAASLDSSGQPGERRAEILLKMGEALLDRRDVRWEVVSPIQAAPKVIVMRRGKKAYSVEVSSRDKKLFRVTRVECKLPGIKGWARSAAGALTQTVQVEGEPRSGDPGGVLTVFTDHPSQSSVNVPIVVLDEHGLCMQGRAFHVAPPKT
jgi:hypothetical protein